MAIRSIRFDKDEILRKKSKIVEVIDDKIRQLILDMLDTMYKENGVGLAAPQVGILKRIITYDVGNGPVAVINPQIKKTNGLQSCEEGCLSFPNIFGTVERPEKIVVEAFDESGKKIKINAEDIEAVVLSHEMDHLDGILFIDKATDIHEVLEGEEENKNKKKNSKNKNKKNLKKV